MGQDSADQLAEKVIGLLLNLSQFAIGTGHGKHMVKEEFTVLNRDVTRIYIIWIRWVP